MSTTPDLEGLLRHLGWVRRLARSLVRGGGRDRADDVAQDTLVTAIERGPARSADLRAWLAAVARNCARKSARTDVRRDRRERAASRSEPLPSASDVVERAQLHRLLVDETLALDEPYRSAVLLRYFEGLSPEAIAERLSIPAPTVRVRIHRAIERLRTRLERRFRGDRRSMSLALADLGGLTMAAKGKTAAIAAATALIVVAGGIGVRFAAREPEEAASPPPAAGRAAPLASSLLHPRPRGAAPGAATEETPAASASLGGLVIDADGQPAAGATVTAIPSWIAASGEAERLVEASADGRFAIGSLEMGRAYSLVATAPGHSPGRLDGVRAGSDVVVRLSRCRSILGVVRDLGGRPVEGARVTWRAVVGGARLEASAVSGPDGSYRLTGVPPCGAFDPGEVSTSHVLATADGFAPAHVATWVGDEEIEAALDIYVSTGGVVRGRVVDAEDGTPLGGARVVLHTLEGSAHWTSLRGVERSNPFSPRVLGEAVAKPDGSFEFFRVPSWGVHTPGRLVSMSLRSTLGVATAEAEGFRTGFALVESPEPGAIVAIEIRCWPAAAVTGRVMDPEGRALPGARVYVTNPSCAEIVTSIPGVDDAVLTDLSGAYVVAAVPARRANRSTAKVDAHLRAGRYGIATGSATVTLVAGDEVEAPDIVVERPASVLVEVVDGAGRPVPDARVSRAPFVDPEGVTGADGRFEFRVWRKDPSVPGSVRLFAWADGFAAGASGEVIPSPIDPPLATIVLGPEHALRGRVEDARSRPVEGAWVLAALAGAAGDDALSEDPRHRRTELPPLAILSFCFSERDGAFELRHLPPGPYVVAAHSSLFGAAGPSVAMARNVDTGAAGVRLVFSDAEAPDDRAAVRCAVRDAETLEPVLRVAAALHDDENGGTISAVCVAPGILEFDGVEPGVWRLEVRAARYATATMRDVSVEPSGRAVSLDVRLERGAAIRGVVRAAAGEALEGGELEIQGADGSVAAETTVEPGGAFAVEGVRAPGRFAVAVRQVDRSGRHVGLWRARAGDEIVLGAGDASEIRRDVVLERAGLVLVSLERSALFPAERGPAANSESLLELRSRSRIEIRDSSGRVAFEKNGLLSDSLATTLACGDHAVSIFVPGYEPFERSIRVGVDSAAEVIMGAE